MSEILSCFNFLNILFILKLSIFLIILSFLASIITYLVFSNSLPYIKTTPTIAVITLTIDVILLFALCFKVIRKIVKTWIERKKGSIGAKISTKFMLTFALLVLIPTVTLATFSSFFFNPKIFYLSYPTQPV